METLTKTNTVLGLKTLIENRFYKYYPELASEKIHVKGDLLRKGHQSNIYQFDVHNTRTVLKSLIVKQRVYNKFYNNHIIENTQKEFDVLKYLNSVPNAKIPAPRALDALPEEGLLITEKVKGKSLYSYLRKNSYLPLTNNRKESLKYIFRKTGEWLRNFHEVNSNGKTGKINTQEFIQKADEIIEKFPSMGLSVDLGNKLITKMEDMEDVVSEYQFPISLKHGDFQPLNIIFNNGKIIVLDISAKGEDITIKDVCNLITGTHIAKLKFLCSFYKTSHINELLDTFLENYYEYKAIPYPVIDFVKTLGFLEQLESIYERNQNPIKRKLITYFYAKEMKKIANGTIKILKGKG